MPHKYQYTLNSTFEESERVPDFVDEIQKETGLDDELSGNFMLLLSEAVSNAIDHGNEGDPGKKVYIDIEITDEKIVASVRDEGKGFTPNLDKDPLSEENLLKESGRGVFILNQLADELEFRDEGRVTEFTLFRK